MNQTSLGWTLLGIPVMVIGSGLGQLTASRISPELFRKLVLIGLAIVGLNFLRRATYQCSGYLSQSVGFGAAAMQRLRASSNF